MAFFLLFVDVVVVRQNKKPRQVSPARLVLLAWPASAA
jgi:hypothetical protein